MLLFYTQWYVHCVFLLERELASTCVCVYVCDPSWVVVFSLVCKL